LVTEFWVILRFSQSEKSPLITCCCWTDSQLQWRISWIPVSWNLTACIMVDCTACISVSRHDTSNRSYLPTYIAKEHHIIIPIFIAARITNLTFQTISYRSWDYKDELVWAATWLYRATNDSTYLNTAESLYKEFGLVYSVGILSWDNKVTGLQVRFVQKFTFTMSVTKQYSHKY